MKSRRTCTRSKGIFLAVIAIRNVLLMGGVYLVTGCHPYPPLTLLNESWNRDSQVQRYTTSLDGVNIDVSGDHPSVTVAGATMIVSNQSQQDRRVIVRPPLVGSIYFETTVYKFNVYGGSEVSEEGVRQISPGESLIIGIAVEFQADAWTTGRTFWMYFGDFIVSEDDAVKVLDTLYFELPRTPVVD